VRFLAPLAVLCILAPTAAAADPPADWKAGVAKTVITPSEPLWMAGYAARTKPAEGKEQELFAKALAVEDAAGTRLVVVTLDLISVPRTLRDRLAAAAREKYRLPPEGLLVNCSHTHCGPELRTAAVPRPGETPERMAQATAYARKLEEQLVELVGAALKDLAPAKLTFVRARCGFAMNRRLPVGGGWANSPNPDGPVDHDVPVLRVEAGGKTRAVLFGYACHNTTLAYYKWCGDYAGFAQEFVERSNPGAVALFLAGCGGDQNPYPRGTPDLARQHGAALATAVAAALQTRPRPVRGPLRLALDLAVIDYAAPLPTKDELVRRKETAKDALDRSHAARLLKHLEDTGSLPASYRAPVQAVRFGDDLLLLALPGETVVDYSLRLKKELGGAGPAVWAAGYSNDVFTYLPSKRVLKEGGYEAGGAMRYSTYPHPGPFADTVEERVIGKALELAGRVSKPAGK
jgi:neutral ceramidase